MNQSEHIAFQYLKEKGIVVKDNTHSKNGSPDFLGEINYEIKKMQGNRIVFTHRQFPMVKEAKIILISQENKVIGVFSFDELEQSKYQVIISSKQIILAMSEDLHFELKKYALYNDITMEKIGIEAIKDKIGYEEKDKTDGVNE